MEFQDSLCQRSDVGRGGSSHRGDDDVLGLSECELGRLQTQCRCFQRLHSGNRSLAVGLAVDDGRIELDAEVVERRFELGILLPSSVELDSNLVPVVRTDAHVTNESTHLENLVHRRLETRLESSCLSNDDIVLLRKSFRLSSHALKVLNPP